MAKEAVNEFTSVNVSGKLTVAVHLKGSQRRYQVPDVQAEVHLNIGGDVAGFDKQLGDELLRLQRAILISCGRASVSE